MGENVTKAIGAAITNLLRPLVMFLLRNGVPYQTFADIAKRVYVDLATEKFDIPGRKQSKSRVAILTGLSRREVLRVKRLPAQDDLGALDRINRAARVISGWVRDRRFSDESGQPTDLPFDGGNVCFLQLVKSYSGDAPARAVLDELMRVGVVERTPDGRIRLLERSYIPKTREIDKIGILGSDTAYLIGTIDHNILRPEAPFFQRKVTYDNLPIEALPKLKEQVGEEGQALLERMDRLMSERDRDVNPRVAGTRQGAGRRRDLLFPGRTRRRKRMMRPVRRTSRLLIGVLLLTLASFTFATCGGGGTDLAGGGSSGTGLSTGSITGFGSVMMNGVEFLTDSNVAPGFVTMKTFMGMDNSSMMVRDLFRVGMVVTIHHGLNDNNAQQIEYQDNLQGPIAAKNSGAENTVTILGQTVVVEDAALFASLNLNEIAEVSGYVDSTGRIRASYIAMVPCSMMMGMCRDSEFEVKGYVSGMTSSGFRLGPLPGGTGTTVTVSYAPAMGVGLGNGMYVQVATADAQPVSGVIAATRIINSPRERFFRRKPWRTSKGWSPHLRAVPGTFSPSPSKGNRCRRTAPHNSPGAPRRRFDPT